MAISCATGFLAAGSLVSVTAIDPEARADTAASAGTPISICWARALGRANRKTTVRRAARRRYPVRSPSLRSSEAAAQTRDSTRGLLELPHLNCETLACKSGTAQSGSIIFPVVRPIPPTLHKETVQLGDFRVPENVRCISELVRLRVGVERLVLRLPGVRRLKVREDQARGGIAGRDRASAIPMRQGAAYRARIHWVCDGGTRNAAIPVWRV